MRFSAGWGLDSASLHQEMTRDLQIVGLSERIQEAYLRVVRQLVDHHGQCHPVAGQYRVTGCAFPEQNWAFGLPQFRNGNVILPVFFPVSLAEFLCRSCRCARTPVE